MIVSSYVSGISPDFSVTRTGNQVSVSFHYDLTGYFDTDQGVYLWDGEIGSDLGAFGGYVHQTFDRPMDLSYVATLAPGVSTAGSYFLSDNIGGGQIEREYHIVQFNDPARFTGTTGLDIVFGSDLPSLGDVIDDGGAGEADVLAGLGGNDIYYVSRPDTVVYEGVGQGLYDTIVVRVSYALNAGQHIEILEGDDNHVAVNLTGNQFAQVIGGNSQNNILNTGGGAWDYLFGKKGDDTFFVFNSDDRVLEDQNEGTDTVKTAVDYKIIQTSYVEILMTGDASGLSAINLTGNKFAQTITGNAGANLLRDGGGVADSLRGLGGNDLYQIYTSATTVTESATQGAADRIMAGVDYILQAGVHVEKMTTNGSTNTLTIDLTGNTFNQEIIGNYGDNRLDGRGGNDSLKGLTGLDTFVFSSVLGSGNVDTILDFKVGKDNIELSDGIFMAIAAGTLASTAFAANSTGNAGDSNDRIIYETDTGELYYDANGTGSGGGILFAKVAIGVALTNADFIVA